MKPTRQQIEEDVKRLAKEQVISTRTIELSDRIIEDLGFDSLDVIEFVIDLETLYDILITDEDIPKYNTIEEWISYVERLTQRS